MILKTKHSPNFSKKIRENKDIKIIVIHYTGMQSKVVSVQRLLDINAKVSCHYLIDRSGHVLKMVEDKKIAWHAGLSKWKNFNNINKNSIGIELVNKGHKHGYEHFSDLQIKILIKLCKILKKKYKIKNSNIVGHSDISPFRKKDPGEKFPWKKLYENKIGIWHKGFDKQQYKLNNDQLRKFFFKNLHKIGYRYLNLKKINKKKDKLVVRAFQRRFCPRNISGKIDQNTYKISAFLAKKA